MGHPDRAKSPPGWSDQHGVNSAIPFLFLDQPNTIDPITAALKEIPDLEAVRHGPQGFACYGSPSEPSRASMDTGPLLSTMGVTEVVIHWNTFRAIIPTRDAQTHEERWKAESSFCARTELFLESYLGRQTMPSV